MSTKTMVSRRGFLQRAGGAAIGLAAPMIVPSRVLGRDGATAPSERITIGCIGLGGQGQGNMRNFIAQPDAQIVALCDVERGAEHRGLATARKTAADSSGKVGRPIGDGSLATYRDFRELLARDDIDAVSIGTPDHWHGLIAVAAARAGKDIYCEKPLSLTLADGRAMVEAVRRNGRILQTGTHRRSSPVARFMCELIRNGRIGKLRKATVEIGTTPGREGPKEPWEEQPVPAWLDYDMWLGPAQWAPYHKLRCLYSFRYINDYSGGEVTNTGAHMLDLVQWASGHDDTGPVEVEDLGGAFHPEAFFNMANPAHFRFRYADGVEGELHSSMRGWCVKLEGDKGWIAFQDRLTASDPKLLNETIGPSEIHLYESSDHMRNFLDCVKSRREPVAPVEVGHRSTSICHLGNIAMTLKARLAWDPAAECFTGHNAAAANRLRHRAGRGAWTV
ncbi:MAG: Gfo/Idh/MocA family oxidoreductase [Verrucomicrobiia bacterium]|jgi:predicted dehydrogenase